MARRCCAVRGVYRREDGPMVEIRNVRLDYSKWWLHVSTKMDSSSNEESKNRIESNRIESIIMNEWLTDWLTEWMNDHRHRHRHHWRWFIRFIHCSFVVTVRSLSIIHHPSSRVRWHHAILQHNIVILVPCGTMRVICNQRSMGEPSSELCFLWWFRTCTCACACACACVCTSW